MKNKIFFIILLIPAFISCSEEWLTLKPENNDLANNFWVLEEDAVNASIAMYDAFDNPSFYELSHIVFGDVWADDMMCPDPNWYIDIDGYTYAADNIASQGKVGNYSGAWFAYYSGVQRSNYLLDNIDKIDKVELSDELRTQLKNEAYFVRAVSYFNIVNVYGDAPLFIHNKPISELYNVNTSPKSDIWNLILEDLNSATNLPKKGITDMGRATRGAAYGFLARANLYLKNYQAAYDACEEIFKDTIGSGSNIYGLEADFGANWDNLSKNGKESIFEIQFKAKDTRWFWGSNPGSWIAAWTGTSSFVASGKAFGIMLPQTHVDTIFEKNQLGQEIDLRREMTIFRPGDVYYLKDSNAVFSSGATTTNLLLAKYIRRNHYNIETDGPYDSDMNMPIIRLAEIYLIHAEAAYELNRTQEAFNSLNRIRQRAGLPSLPNDGSVDFMAALRHERRIEFLGEGHRFFDLRRWGLLQQVLGPLGYDGREYMPIPETEQNVNQGNY